MLYARYDGADGDDGGHVNLVNLFIDQSCDVMSYLLLITASVIMKL